jgi:hypothetical protein
MVPGQRSLRARRRSPKERAGLAALLAGAEALLAEPVTTS